MVTSTGNGSIPRYNRLVTSRFVVKILLLPVDGGFMFFFKYIFCPSWENDPILTNMLGMDWIHQGVEINEPLLPTLTGTGIQSYRPAGNPTDQFMMTHRTLHEGFWPMARQWMVSSRKWFDTNISLCSPRNLGKKLHCDSYLSIGLEPPTRCSHEMDWLIVFLFGNGLHI